MLSELYIENIAVISQATIRLAPGLNVFTGETGAGKTILVSAINAVLGARTYRDIIRTGETRALVSALFTHIPDDVADEIGAMGFPVEDGQLLVSRTLDLGGGGSSKIAGRPATATLLRDVCGLLIDIHGQHDNQELLSPERHVRFLDNFGGLENLLAQYSTAWQEVTALRDQLDKIQIDEGVKLQRQDMLTYQIQEIEGAALVPGEDEELQSQRERIKNAEKITMALAAIYDVLQGGDENPGVLDAVEALAEPIATAGQYVTQLAEFDERTAEAVVLLRELSATARTALDDFAFDPRQVDEIEFRLDTLYRMKKKYGTTVEEVLEYLENCRQELDQLTFSDQLAEKLTAQLEAATNRASTLAAELTDARLEAAGRFVRLVEEELNYLDMGGVTLSVSHSIRELGPGGRDSLEFLIVTNPGEPAKPLSRIASGGELSRIMLSMKNVLADRDGVGAIIFDEVDSGVSGRAAQKIGLKLSQVSTNRQVICVTHLAPVAAYGDHHIRIYKTVEEGRTHTKVEVLDRAQRVEELARITVGDHITEISRQSAAEMLTAAGK